MPLANDEGKFEPRLFGPGWREHENHTQSLSTIANELKSLQADPVPNTAILQTDCEIEVDLIIKKQLFVLIHVRFHHVYFVA